MDSACDCPACGCSDSAHLGSLGTLEWFRCRACGMTFSYDPTRSSEEETSEDSEPEAEFVSVLSSGFRDQDFPECDCDDCRE